jgi:hypothetical protein
MTYDISVCKSDAGAQRLMIQANGQRDSEDTGISLGRYSEWSSVACLN